MSDKRPQILMSVQAERSLARVSDAKPIEAQAIHGASVADMLGKLHQVAAQLIYDIELSQESPAKRLAMARDAARLIPLLAKAERNVHKGVGKKDVEDMTDAELRIALRRAKAR